MNLIPRITPLLAALGAAAVLGGCSSGVPLDQKAPVETQTATPVGAATGSAAANGVAGQGAAQSSVAAVQTGGAGAAGGGLGPTADVGRSVYFGYDSYTVDPRYQPTLQGNAQYLSTHPAAHVQLQGNTDARGSREYNLALGQKRADAVRRSLELLGVKPSQMEAISFGKEKPKALGSTPEDYAMNRRVDIVYQP
jgi:peptidoglycan-associated lipoprotein